jgi:hypothetical protein
VILGFSFTAVWSKAADAAWAFKKYEIQHTTERLFLKHYLQDGLWCYSAFHHCDKISEIFNLEGEKVYLGHGFRSFHPWSFGLIASGPMVA